MRDLMRSAVYNAAKDAADNRANNSSNRPCLGARRAANECTSADCRNRSPKASAPDQLQLGIGKFSQLLVHDFPVLVIANYLHRARDYMRITMNADHMANGLMNACVSVMTHERSTE
jgi:hypothetical protein